jgi:hypothetical protein
MFSRTINCHYYWQPPHTGRYNNKPHHPAHTVTVSLPKTVADPYQMPPQYAQHTAYIGCDFQIGACGGSGSHSGISVSVTVGFVQDEVSVEQVTVLVILFSPVRIIPPTFQIILMHMFLLPEGQGSKGWKI